MGLATERPSDSGKAQSPSAVLSSGQMTDYREWLLGILTERQKNSPNYSLRALARSIGVSPATLSQVMSGKRRLTEKTVMKISARMGLSTLEKEALLEMCQKGSDAPPAANSDYQWRKLSEDVFTLISKWYHYAILELTDLPEHQSDPAWIAKKLAISPAEAVGALNRLSKLGLIQISPEGRLIRTSKPVTAGDHVPSEAVREHHRSQLRKADYSLRNHPMHARYFTSGTLAIDPKNLPKAQEAIKGFRRKLCKMLGAGNPSRIYVVSFQLFPVDREIPNEAH